MKTNKCLIIGLAGLTLGVLLNSVEIKESKPFRFNNPIPFSKEVTYLNTDKNDNPYFVTEQVTLSGRDEQEIINRRPLMFDTNYNLNLFGLRLPILTIRTVQDESLFKVYSGRLDKEGDIHSSEGIWELQCSHDTSWYKKK